MAGGNEPRVGQIVDHYFLWVDEQAAGRIEGRKARPCVIVAVEPREGFVPIVTVLPITSQKPHASSTAIAIPDSLKSRLGLDQSRAAWVVIDDANVFAWPGFDLVPQPGGGFVRGVVTSGLFGRIRQAILEAAPHGRPRPVNRDEA